MAKLPVIDLHCDLLDYLVCVENANPLISDELGCSVPMLKDGGVKLQVMAIYTATEQGSSRLGLAQADAFRKMTSGENRLFAPIKDVAAWDGLINSDSDEIGAIAAIENASGFCEEDEPLSEGMKKLENILEKVGKKVLYIGLTHHLENRFGGGNSTDIGLKEDGKVILDYMSGKKIALDFAHTSDRLAYDLLDYIDAKSLDIPIMASHSNMRQVCGHERNLPDELAKTIIDRGGVLGINFLRAFVNDERPDALAEHVKYALNLGGGESLAFGADFFYTKDMEEDGNIRMPYYHPEHENASKYPQILSRWEKGGLAVEELERIRFSNADRFLRNLLS